MTILSLSSGVLSPYCNQETVSRTTSMGEGCESHPKNLNLIKLSRYVIKDVKNTLSALCSVPSPILTLHYFLWIIWFLRVPARPVSWGPVEPGSPPHTLYPLYYAHSLVNVRLCACEPERDASLYLS